MRLPLAPLAAASSLALLAACGDPWTSPVDNANPSGPVNVGYQCEDGQRPVVRWFGTERATVRLDDGRAVDLAPRTGGAPGVFEGQDVTVLDGDDEIRLAVAGRETRCEKIGLGPSTY